MNGGDAAKQRSPDGNAKRSDEPQKLMFHAAKLQASRNFQKAFRLCAQSVLFLVSISIDVRKSGLTCELLSCPEPGEKPRTVALQLALKSESKARHDSRGLTMPELKNRDKNLYPSKRFA